MSRHERTVWQTLTLGKATIANVSCLLQHLAMLFDQTRSSPYRNGLDFRKP